jgi:diaminopimelate decarboxylase
LRAGFQPENIVWHGNAKTDEDIGLALDSDIKALVVDSEDELKAISKIVGKGKKARIALRVNLGDPSQGGWDTSKSDSKFGIPYEEVGGISNLIEVLGNIELIGLHTHIGSQKSNPVDYLNAAEKMAQKVIELESRENGAEIEFLSLGGGFPVRYLLWTDYMPDKKKNQPDREELEAAFDMSTFGPLLCEHLNTLFKDAGTSPPKLLFEPGRFIVASSGVLLTTVQTNKTPEAKISGKSEPKNWLAVDAGCHTLTDCWTYQWFFECLPVSGEALHRKELKTYNVAGPLCDSGDVLARDRLLPSMERGELLAFLQVGAYQLEQQSTFNLFPRAAAVLVNSGTSRLIRQREKDEDL